MLKTPEYSTCKACGVGLFYGSLCPSCGPRPLLDAPDLFTIAAAARALGVPASEVRRFVDACGPSARDGRRIRVRLTDIRTWLEDRARTRRNFEEFMTSP